MSGRGRKIVLDITFVVVMTQTAAIRVVISIRRRSLVLAIDFPPYQAARKHPPITPALARSLSKKNATVLSNNHDRPATLLISSNNRSLSCINQPANDAAVKENKMVRATVMP